MDPVEVRMRCLELVMSEYVSDFELVFRTVEGLEKFVLSAELATPHVPSDKGQPFIAKDVDA